MVAAPYAFVGDHSWSNSEKWSMSVGGTTVAATEYGEVERETLQLAKGESYPISVSHTGTNIEDGPDYDYRAWIDDSANPRWTSGSSTPSGDDFFVDNSSELLQRRYFGDDDNFAAGKSATLHIPLADLDIDSDESGVIDDSDDHVELDSRQGKKVEIYGQDLDEDGVTDVIDHDGIAGAHFEPVELSLSDNVADAAYGGSIFVKFDYDMANMGLVDGEFRLWTEDADADRSSASKLINTGSWYTANTLGVSPGDTATFFLEGVKKSSRTVHHDAITVTVVTTGTWNGEMIDVIHARAVGVNGDLALEGLEDGIEASEGAFFDQNADDDDRDGIHDHIDMNGVVGEDSLTPIYIGGESEIDGYFYVLYDSSLVSLWSNQDRTDAVSSFTNLTLEDLNKTYYVDGIEEGIAEIELQFHTDTDILVLDTIQITVSASILVAIDGTGSGAWSEDPAFEIDLPDGSTRTQSHVRNFSDDYVGHVRYLPGPPNDITLPSTMQSLLEQGFDFIEAALEENPHRKIDLVGHSRGGYIVMELARFMATALPDVDVRYMGLYDPVDMVPGWGDAETVPANVEHVTMLLAAGTPEEIGPEGATTTVIGPDGQPTIVPLYQRSRWWFNRANAGPESFTTDYQEHWLFGTHGGIGGAPWEGDRPIGHSWGNDKNKAIEADTLVRGHALTNDVPIIYLQVSDYGYQYTVDPSA